MGELQNRGYHKDNFLVQNINVNISPEVKLKTSREATKEGFTNVMFVVHFMKFFHTEIWTFHNLF